MKNLKIFIVIYIVAMLLTACGGTVDQLSDLEGTDWVLTAYNKNQPMAGREPSISFEGGEVSGQTGCNSYFGSYDADDEKLGFGMMGMTEMWCEDVADQEMVYMELLGQAESYQIADGVLTIFCGHQQTLTFMPME